MRIAVVSTVYMRTPPEGYGGIERVVHTYTEELVRQGHDVTLFATPGSWCSGATIEVSRMEAGNAPPGIRSPRDVLSEEPLYRAMSAHLKEHPVDVIHDWSFQNLYVQRHPERFPFLISTCIPQPRDYVRRNLVASSRAHAAVVGKEARYVHYGLQLQNWEYRYDKPDPMIHIAKIARYKGQHEAMLASARAGRRLVIAGNIEGRKYHWAVVRPLVALLPNVTYVGEVKNTNPVLARSRCLVQTPKWFDAFPLIILEALASGTPVIAYPRGGVTEQIEHGVNGFLCKGVSELAAAMRDIDQIRPEACRQFAEEHFSVARMAREYLALMEEVRGGLTW